MGDKFNFLIDSLISVFLRFLELPFFAIFIGLVIASGLIYLLLKVIFRNKFRNKFYRRAGGLALIVLCLVFFDKKISLLQNEINVVNEKVENVAMNSSQVIVKNNIKFDKNFRPCGRNDINGIIKENDLDISRYLKYVFNRNYNTKVEFEIFPSDLNGQDPKQIINNLKSKILNLL